MKAAATFTWNIYSLLFN